MSDPETGDTGFDMESAVASIADGLGLQKEPEGDELPEGKPEGEVETESEAESEKAERARDKDGKFAAASAKDTTTPTAKPRVTEADPAATPRPAPKSWAKETHERWAKLDKDTQDYIEKREKDFLDGTEQYRGEATFAKEFKDVINPYRPMLAAMGVSEKQAVSFLLNWQYRLSNGSPEQRMAAYHEMGNTLGLITREVDPNAPKPDPAIIALQTKLERLESATTQRQQADLNAAKADAQSKVEQFASDPANLHFDAVASDMVPHINAGLPLKDAYDKAVWANPVTREKMLQQRQTDEAAKLKEKTRAEGEAARRSTSQNVRGVESSRKAPTAPKGSIDDTMRDTLRDIKGRAH